MRRDRSVNEINLKATSGGKIMRNGMFSQQKVKHRLRHFGRSSVNYLDLRHICTKYSCSKFVKIKR